VSNVDAAQLAEAQAIAPVTAVQNRHTDGPGLLAPCEKAGIAYVPYFPLGGGVEPLDTARLGKVAARLGATTAQVALASLLATSPSVLAIPGTGRLDHLEENLAANDLSLTDEDLSDLRG
jgi:aryl-alcohol dehydrogenase-like predicted oxidoreductase